MSEHPHKFRYLLPPGSNFQFMAKAKFFLVLALLIFLGTGGALAYNRMVRGSFMNWTIDFKGGTEVTLIFRDKADASKVEKADPHTVREALKAAGEEGFDVSSADVPEKIKNCRMCTAAPATTGCGPKATSCSPDNKCMKADNTCIEDETEVRFPGMLVRTPRFSAMKPEQAATAQAAFLKMFGPDPAHPDADPATDEHNKQVLKATWSGERLYVRSLKSFVGVDASAAFAAATITRSDGKVATVIPAPLVLKPWTEDDSKLYGHPDEGTKEYHSVFTVRGIDQQIETTLEKALPGIDAQVVQSYGVGAKAGAELRNDALKSVIYALFLIVLYLAFRFDLRYAPGAAFATVHDALAVILVFAITWTEVSLTTVAAILTVIGYSVNDTVIIFDRIRENQAKLKDKKLERIIDISLNETLVRSILTSSTVFATTLIMNIFGDGLVRNFAFAMNIGVIVGTYSSIFLASPIFLWVSRKFYSGPPKVRAYKQHAIQAEE